MADAARDLDPTLLEIVACPACRGSLVPRDGFLVCAACALGYPVRDGVPVLLADDAVGVDPSGSIADGSNGDPTA